jgi:hypothetical protein
MQGRPAAHSPLVRETRGSAAAVPDPQHSLPQSRRQALYASLIEGAKADPRHTRGYPVPSNTGPPHETN